MGYKRGNWAQLGLSLTCNLDRTILGGGGSGGGWGVVDGGLQTQ